MPAPPLALNPLKDVHLVPVLVYVEMVDPMAFERSVLRHSIVVQCYQRCYQNTPYLQYLGRHPAIQDRLGLFGLGCLGSPEYGVRGNS